MGTSVLYGSVPEPPRHATPGGVATTTRPPLKVHIALPTVFATFATVAAAFVIHNVLDDARRSLGWFFAAAVVAIVIAGPVEALSRWMRRSVAVVVVLLATGGVIGAVGYGALNDLSRQLRRFENEVPKAARQIEASDRFGAVARDLDLDERAESVADVLSNKLWGEARATASHSGAYFAGTVLMLFLLAWLPRFVDGGLAQIEDGRRRERLRTIVEATLRDARRYLQGTIAIAAFAGGTGFVVARLASLPAPVALGVFVAVFSIVPYMGVAIGSLPTVLLAAAFESSRTTIVLVAALVGLQVGVALAQRRLQRATLYVGPGVTLVAGLLGFAAYNLGGAVFGIAAAVFALAVVDAVSRDEALREPVDAGAGAG